MKNIALTLLILLSFSKINAQSKKQLAASIDNIMKDYASANAPGASVLVFQHDKIVFEKGYGVINIKTQEPINPNTNFRLASVTKQFTAMSILLLEQRHMLSLEDPITKYLPGFPAYGKNIKIKHLLTHSAGLVDYEDLMPLTQTTQLHDTNCLQLMFRTDSLYFPAGTQYKYSNTGYAILALVVEQVSGISFAQFLQQNIFKPLGMKTTVAFEEGKSVVANRAYGHSFENGAWSQTDQSLTSAVLGDGGIYTNTEEYTKWIKALWSYRFLNEAQQQRAWARTKLDNGIIIDYGYGWHVEDFKQITHPFHDGSSIGFRNSVGLFPEQKLMVIVLTNRNEHDPIEEVHKIASLYLP
jgi:CubicO group peptidase (beta-lactamase class C family)